MINKNEREYFFIYFRTESSSCEKKPLNKQLIKLKIFVVFIVNQLEKIEVQFLFRIILIQNNDDALLLILNDI